jgi:hypothetical protein
MFREVKKSVTGKKENHKKQQLQFALFEMFTLDT